MYYKGQSRKVRQLFCCFDFAALIFDIMNKIVADGVDRHLVNVEERRIMIDKKYYEKAARYVGTRALTDVIFIFIGINDFVRKIEKFFRCPLGQT